MQRDADGQFLDAADKVGTQEFVFAIRFYLFEPFAKLLEQDADFEAREPHAKADMRAGLAKGHVLVRGTQQVDAEGVVKDGIVAVG